MEEKVTAPEVVKVKKPLLPDTFLGGQTVHNLIIIAGIGTILYMIIKCSKKLGK